MLRNPWHSGDIYMPYRIDQKLQRAHWYKISHNWPLSEIPAHRNSHGKLVLHGTHSPECLPVLVQQDSADLASSLAGLLSQLAMAKPGGGSSSSSDDDNAPLSRRLRQKGGHPLWRSAKMPLSEFIVPDED